jgi:hypothetical protein
LPDPPPAAAKLVHGLDRHEQHEGHDQEADHIVDEEAIFMVGAPACHAAASDS